MLLGYKLFQEFMPHRPSPQTMTMTKILKSLVFLFVCIFLTFYLMRTHLLVVLIKYLKLGFLAILGKSKENKIILLYTTFGTDLYWKDLEEEKLSDHLEKAGCKIKSCIITYNRRQVELASALLFHAQDLHTDEIYSRKNLLHLTRPRSQIWVWVNQESPVNLNSMTEYNELFNWTATYHRNSDIFLPYFSYSQQKNFVNTTNHFQISRKILKSKTKLVAWLVSHCGGIREEYVLQLQNLIDVTVYGQCKHRFKLQGSLCIRNSKECLQELNKYKFYLSFENSICNDYITEKYWENALMSYSVPIVMGANYDSVVAVPGSFINVLNFRSIKQLALYINYLDKNDAQYLKHFEWRRKYTIHPTDDLICSVCQKLHEDTPHSTYNHLDKFWSKKKSCSFDSRAMRTLRRHIEDSKKGIYK